MCPKRGATVVIQMVFAAFESTDIFIPGIHFRSTDTSHSWIRGHSVLVNADPEMMEANLVRTVRHLYASQPRGPGLSTANADHVFGDFQTAIQEETERRRRLEDRDIFREQTCLEVVCLSIDSRQSTARHAAFSGAFLIKASK